MAEPKEKTDLQRLLLEKLRYYEVKEINVSYSGSGDSGNIDVIDITSIDDEEMSTDELASLLVPEYTEHRYEYTRAGQKVRPNTLADLLETVVLEIIDSRYPGWEINAGGCGAVTICPADPQPISSSFDEYEDDEDYDEDEDA